MGSKLISSSGLFAALVVASSFMPTMTQSHCTAWKNSAAWKKWTAAWRPATVRSLTVDVDSAMSEPAAEEAHVRLAPARPWPAIHPAIHWISFQEPATQSDDPEAPMARRRPRRLPTYFSRVVTQKQREEIYEIQDRFEVELEALQQQVEAKTMERDQEIEAVLSAEQLAEVKRLTEEARQRRLERTGGATTEESDESESSSGDGNGNLPERA